MVDIQVSPWVSHLRNIDIGVLGVCSTACSSHALTAELLSDAVYFYNFNEMNVPFNGAIASGFMPSMCFSLFFSSTFNSFHFLLILSFCVITKVELEYVDFF